MWNWILCIFCLLFSLSLRAELVVTTIPPQSDNDASHSYYIGLLKLALQKTENDSGSAKVVFADSVLEQGRAIHELELGRMIDLYWAGTSTLREQRLLPIRVPLIGGALGFRKAIIRKDQRARFDQITTLAELKALVACQGMHWPDSDILEYSGVEVLRIARFEQMFTLVDKGRCDYFPRAVHEGVVEIKMAVEKYPSLELYHGWVLQYTFPMYFFVSPSRPEVAKRIESGLRRALADGSMLQYMQQHEVTKHLFPVSEWMLLPRIPLVNPDLPGATPLDDELLWLQPE